MLSQLTSILNQNKQKFVLATYRLKIEPKTRLMSNLINSTRNLHRVLGEVVHHTEFDSTLSIEAIDSEEPNDESFDSMTITLTLATAPKQDVSESQL